MRLRNDGELLQAPSVAICDSGFRSFSLISFDRGVPGSYLLYVCMYACMHACMHACMYVHMYHKIYHIYIYRETYNMMCNKGN